MASNAMISVSAGPVLSAMYGAYSGEAMQRCSASTDGKVKIGYRPVHLFTLSNEVQVFPPKARTY